RAQELALPPRRHVAEHAHLAAGGIEQTAQHLERGGLARAVRSEKTDDLAFADRERDRLDGWHVLEAAPKERAQRGQHAFCAFVDAKDLAQIANKDGWLGGGKHD